VEKKGRWLIKKPLNYLDQSKKLLIAQIALYLAQEQGGKAQVYKYT